MKSPSQAGSWPALLLLTVLTACSSIPPSTLDDSGRERLYQAKRQQLAGFDQWALEGRLAIRNSEDGGSGTFSWSNSSGDSRMDFHGALGRGAWRLLAGQGAARLELADGTVHHAMSVNELVRLQLGWEIPVDSLSWWVRGLAAPGASPERTMDENGNLLELHQDGWTVEYGKYRAFDGISLPVKVNAHQAGWRVKLAVRDWSIGEGTVRDE